MNTMTSCDIIIVTVDTFPNNFSTGNHIRRICRGLQLNGWQPGVVSTNNNAFVNNMPKQEYDQPWQIPYHISTIYKKVWSKNYFIKAAAFAKALYPALLSVLKHGKLKAVILYEGSFTSYMPLFHLCKRHSVPVIPYLIEDYNFKIKFLLSGSYIDRYLYSKALIQKCTGIIGISHYWHKFAKQSGVPFAVVPSYLPTELTALPSVDSPSFSKPGPIKVATIGAWTQRELPQTLFSACKLIKKQGFDIRYNVISKIGYNKGEKKAYRRFLSDQELQQMITLHGWVESCKMDKIMQEADMFVLLRRNDKETAALFPTRIPEYLLYKRPMILSYAGDLPMYFEHMKSAYFIRPGNAVVELRDAILSLVNNRERAAMIASGGYTQALKHFSIEGNGLKMSQFIHRLMSYSKA